MWLRCIILLLLCINGAAIAQVGDTTIVYADSTIFYSDSSLQVRDTSAIYTKIQNYSNRKKFTKILHGIFFKPVVTVTPKKKVYKKLVQKPYSRFDGLIIRNIDIETLDPFGYSIADTAVKPQNVFLDAGNALHLKSQSLAIRNLLLIRKNQIFDSLRVKESERLVRSRNYVYDVSFFVRRVSPKSDSVDIYIRVMDNWSIVPKIANSSSSFIFSLKDNNFAGLGHTFQNDLTWYHDNRKVSGNLNYFVPSIRNTYISSNIHYGTDAFGNFSKGIAVDRPFFSPYAKWAAGVVFSQQNFNHVTVDDSGGYLPHYTFTTQDCWAGKATEVRQITSATKHTTNVIYAARFFKIRYLEKPDLLVDTLRLFANERNYLASIGLSTRNYVQDKYIFKFGLIEDVPIGRVLNLTGGYQYRENIERLYLGARISSGYYYTWGYLGLNVEYGTYFRASQKEQGLLTASANYVTGLIDIGNWKLRQFVKPQITLGYHLMPTDSLTINDRYGLAGFKSTTLSGTGRLLLSLQTQAYAPWNIIGFRFGPYFLCSMGMLGNAVTGFRKSTLYSQFGIGVLIKNEHLIFKTFQISLAYYPIIPGKNNGVFKINSFRTSDYGFRDFEIGKPSTVAIE